MVKVVKQLPGCFILRAASNKRQQAGRSNTISVVQLRFQQANKYRLFVFTFGYSFSTGLQFWTRRSLNISAILKAQKSCYDDSAK